MVCCNQLVSRKDEVLVVQLTVSSVSLPQLETGMMASLRCVMSSTLYLGPVWVSPGKT